MLLHIGAQFVQEEALVVVGGFFLYDMYNMCDKGIIKLWYLLDMVVVRDVYTKVYAQSHDQ